MKFSAGCDALWWLRLCYYTNRYFLFFHFFFAWCGFCFWIKWKYLCDISFLNSDINPIIFGTGLGGFVACRALSQQNTDPSKASRPWDTVILIQILLLFYPCTIVWWVCLEFYSNLCGIYPELVEIDSGCCYHFIN